MDFQLKFSKDITGCGDIFIGDHGISRTESPEVHTWHLGSAQVHQRSIEDVFPVFGEEIPQLVSHSLRSSYEHTRKNPIDWSSALGPQRFARSLKASFSSSSSSIERIIKSRYAETLIKGREILTRLQPALVDLEAFREVTASSNLGYASTFEPGPDGFARPIRYSHSTSTGRLTVASGPRILSLPKGERRIIRSRWEQGQVFMVDFVSLEPRVMLLLTRDEAPKDIYEAMRTELDLPDATRARLKLATISSLYGSKSQDPALVAAVNRFFRSSEVGRRHLSSEEVCNLYGRKLSPEEASLRLSHFVQSTAVDVALLGFSSLLKLLPGGCIPLFLIHDALVIDVPPDCLSEFPQDMSIRIEPLGEFYLSSKKLQADI